VLMIFRKKIIFISGFTLMELMVTIAIIAIMSSIAIPNMIGWLPDYRLRSAARDIVSCMQQAKLRAVEKNANAVIIFKFQNNQSRYIAWVDNGMGTVTIAGVVVNAAGNGLPDTNAGEVIFEQGVLPAGISFYRNTTFVANTFGFNSMGFPIHTSTSLGNGTVYIKNNKSNYRAIIVNTAGNIRVQKSSNGISWN